MQLRTILIILWGFDLAQEEGLRFVGAQGGHGAYHPGRSRQERCPCGHRDGSDLALLVDALPGATLLDLGNLEDDLTSLLGVEVDVLTPGDLPPTFRSQVLAVAKPV